MTETQLYLLLAAVIAALAAAVLTWLLLRSRHQAALQNLRADHREETAALQNSLTEISQQHQFAAQEQAEAESALASLQQQYQHTQHALATAEAVNRQLPPLQHELQQSRAQAQDLQSQVQELHSRFAAARQHIDSLQHNHQAQEQESGRLKADYAQLQQNLADTQIRNERLATQIEQERLAHEEKLALLTEARQSLTDQFQNLANNILEEKSKKFSEHNHESINRLLTPLNERMGKFSELVQNTYEKEAKERNTLENELKRLQTLNSQLHTDAQALTQALTGSQNKTQGNWGEMILETVLENSGLQKGREYIVQAGGTRTEEDGSIRRLQPDVLVNLPDHKQIIIDSKVSLTAYVRYTQAQNSDDAAQALTAHVASIRAHIKSLSLKQYSDIEGVNTLDFVFMFIPVEPAYLLALQHDHSLFQECFDKRIMLVGPSTLLATLRTVANIWRNEQQNQNALAIAEEGGRLYDKFVGFITTLEGVGKNIDQAQSQYQAAYKQLSEGRGNLVNRAEKLRKLGIKASKQIDKALAEQAQESLTALPDGADEKDDDSEAV
ncbi:MAG: DNA recombination protein RmuC [Neisseria sp.]|nr:DNA recombination protein RmuC [Neisseria sp.]